MCIYIYIKFIYVLYNSIYISIEVNDFEAKRASSFFFINHRVKAYH